MNIQKFNIKTFTIVTLLTSIWIHISETFRYEVFVAPRVRLFFENKSGVADMDTGIFIIWVFWDTLVTAVLIFTFWLYSRVFGNTNRAVLISGTLVWLAIFVVFWVATVNMGLSEWKALGVILPLCWLEMIIGTWIASKLYKKHKNDEI